jgi:hypothetical protein
MLALSQTPATTLPAVEAESIMTEHKLLGYQERFIRLQAFLKKCDDDEQDLLQGKFKSLDFSRHLISLLLMPFFLGGPILFQKI